MRALTLTLLASTGLCFGACAEPAAPSTQEQAQPAQERPVPDAPKNLTEATAGPSNIAMWKTGDEDTTVYMIGTVHLLNKGVEWKTDRFETAFGEADAIFLEADVLSPEVEAQMQSLIPQLALNPEGVTLASYFTEDEQAQLSEALQSLGVTLEQLAPFRPWFASINMGVLAIRKAGGSADAGLEMVIATDAAEAGKPMRYLETAEDQLRMLASFPDQKQADFMVAELDNFDDVEGYFARLVGAWYDGEPKEVAAILNESFKDYPEIAEALLYKRNANWADQLDTLIEEEAGTYLVAVGAGHLAGPKSLQDYLEEEGHTVDRF